MNEITTPAPDTYFTIERKCYDGQVISFLTALAPHTLKELNTTDWFTAKDFLKLVKKYKLNPPHYTDASTLNSHLEAFFGRYFEIPFEGFMAEQFIDRHTKNPPMKICFKYLNPTGTGSERAGTGESNDR